MRWSVYLKGMFFFLECENLRTCSWPCAPKLKVQRARRLEALTVLPTSSTCVLWGIVGQVGKSHVDSNSANQ